MAAVTAEGKKEEREKLKSELLQSIKADINLNEEEEVSVFGGRFKSSDLESLLGKKDSNSKELLGSITSGWIEDGVLLKTRGDHLKLVSIYKCI